MLSYPPLVALLHGFPETLVFVFLVYSLLGIKGQAGRIIVLAALDLGLIMVLRNIGAPFPAHTFFVLVVMPVVISLWENLALKTAILAWSITLGVLLFFELSFLWLVMYFYNISLERVFAEPLLWSMIGWPQVIALFLLALWLRRHGGFIKFFEGVSRP